MANYNKSFNFRNGVQVDNDNFVVNANGLVGIGTSIPTTFLDVYGTSELRGDVTVSGLVTSTQLYVNGQSHLDGELYVSGVSTVGFLTSGSDAYVSGVVTATKFYGDGSSLSNIIGFSTNAWIVHNAIGSVDPLSGLSTVTSIGIGTTQANLLYDLVIGQDPNNSKEGICFDGRDGNIRSSGIITATKFSGPITGTVTGNVTGTVTGDVTGNIIGAAGTITNFEVTGVSTFTGISTFNNNVHVEATIDTNQLNVSGVTTFASNVEINGNTTIGNVDTDTVTINARVNDDLDPSGDGAKDLGQFDRRWKDLYLSGVSSSSTLKVNQGFAEIINTSGISTISIGQSVGAGNSSAGLRFGNPIKEFDIINYDNGNINTYIDLNEVGLSTGNFRWIHKNSNVRMVLTYDGNLGIGEASPEYKLHVGGTSKFDQAAQFDSNLTVDGTLTVATFSPTQINNTSIFNSSGISTYYNLNVTNRIGINSEVPIAGLDAQNATAYLSNVGVNTISLYGNRLAVDGNSSFTGNLGIGTTNPSIIGDYGSLGALQVHGGDLVLDGSLVISNTKYGTGIGIGTTGPSAAVDFSKAGIVGTNNTFAYMLPPKVSTSQRDGTGGNVGIATIAGGIIYNTTLSKLQVYNGSSWGGTGDSGSAGFVNISDYGADTTKTDGTNVTAINNAITALGGKGGTVYIPSGQYYLNAAIELTAAADENSIRFVGAGQQNYGGSSATDTAGTVLRRDADDEFFNITNSRAIHFKGITFKGGASTGSGGNSGISGGNGAIYVVANAGCQGYLIDNCVFHGIANCIHFKGLSDSIVRGCRFRNVPTNEGAGTLIKLDENGGEPIDQIRIQDCVLDGSPDGTVLNGVVDGIGIYNTVTTVYITNTSAIRLKRAFYTDSNWDGNFLYFQNSEAERSTNDGFSLNGSGNFITIDNCFACTCGTIDGIDGASVDVTSHGINILSNQNSSINITNPNVRDNTGHGILLDGTANNYSIVNPAIGGNSKNATGTNHGIVVGSTANNVYISGGKIGGNTAELAGTGTQDYGIFVDGATHSNIRIIGTNVTGNQETDGISMTISSGTGNSVKFNAGSSVDIDT